MNFTKLKDIILNVLLHIFDMVSDLLFTVEMGLKADWVVWNYECYIFIMSCKYIFGISIKATILYN